MNIPWEFLAAGILKIVEDMFYIFSWYLRKRWNDQSLALIRKQGQNHSWTAAKLPNDDSHKLTWLNWQR